MEFTVFSQQWATACREAINHDMTYRKAAADWEWPLMLVMQKDTDAGVVQEAMIYLDLFHGECREARVGTPADVDEAAFVIAASPQEWQAVLGGRRDPMLALMLGKLTLQKGNRFKLARFGPAARQLVVAASAVPATFPGLSIAPAPTEKVEAPSNPAPEKPPFVTTSPGGLHQDAFPMKLYHKAKRLGIWNPQDIDFDTDRRDWQGFSNREKEVLLHLTALFQAGEESVTRDLLPLMMVIAEEGRLEEEMFLTTFLWEEAKHTEFFRRFLDEVAENSEDLTRFHSPSYRRIFYEALPAAMNALKSDSSPAAQVRASVTYNMIVEGTLAETGYHAYFEMLTDNDLLPGMREGIGYLKRDESRHIAYGIYLLSRLVNAHPALWETLESQMERLLSPTLEIINELFVTYDPMPFGLRQEVFVDYAMSQFKSRMSRIERAIHNGFENNGIDSEMLP